MIPGAASGNWHPQQAVIRRPLAVLRPARRASRHQSGSLTALQARRGTPRVPLQYPSTPVPGPPAPRWPPRRLHFEAARCSGSNGVLAVHAADPWRLAPSRVVIWPAIGRLQAGPRPGQTHSGPVRALQAHGGTPGYPLQHPSTSIPSVASGSRPPRPPPPSLQHPSTSIPGAAGSALARWPVGPRRHPGLLRLSTLDQAAPDRAARCCGSY